MVNSRLLVRRGGLDRSWLLVPGDVPGDDVDLAVERLAPHVVRLGGEGLEQQVAVAPEGAVGRRGRRGDADAGAPAGGGVAGRTGGGGAVGKARARVDGGDLRPPLRRRVGADLRGIVEVGAR